MPFHSERELRRPLETWLRDAGFQVRHELALLGRRADLVGVRDGRILAVEMKLRDWSEALRQAIAYQLAAEDVWVAMPLASAARAYRHRWAFESEGVGLLAVDDEGVVRRPIPAWRSPRLLPFAAESVLRTFMSPAPGTSVFSKEETVLQAF